MLAAPVRYALLASLVTACFKDPSPVDAPSDAPSDAALSDRSEANDALSADASPPDSAPVDASPLDASLPDASLPDASPLDVTSMDASPTDVAREDVALYDGAIRDASPADVIDASASPSDVRDASAPTAPLGWIEVVTSAGVVSVASGLARATVRCRFHSQETPPCTAPPLRLRVSPSADLATDGTLTLTTAGVYGLTCETTDGSLAGRMSITAVDSAVPSPWAQGSATISALGDGIGAALLADAVDDRAALTTALARIDDAVVRLPTLVRRRPPAVWGWPGGYPSSATLTSAGFAPRSNDAALLAALDAAASALSDMRSIAVGASSGDATAPVRLGAAGARLDAALSALRARSSNVQLAVVNRERIQRLLADDLVPTVTALGAMTQRLMRAEVAGLPAPPDAGLPFLFSATVSLMVEADLRIAMSEQVYGEALDWIDGATRSLATSAVIARSYGASSSGPMINSINTSNVLHDGDAVTVYGERFSADARNNMVLIVNGDRVTAAVGAARTCSDLTRPPSASSPTFVFDYFSYLESAYDCGVSLADVSPSASPTREALGVGAVDVTPGNPFGEYTFSIGTLPVHHPTGRGLPVVIGFIPINLEGAGMRVGSSVNVLLYP